MKAFLIAAFLSVGMGTSALAAELNVCTGAEGGYYEQLGNRVVASLNGKIAVEKINVVNTGGSIESAEMFNDGDCQIAILQADAVTSMAMPDDIKVVDGHTEAVFWIYGKKGIDDFGKLEDGDNPATYAVAVVDGSGSEVTMRNFAKVDEDYKDIRTIEFYDWQEAASAAAQGSTRVAGVNVKIAGLLYVGRPGKLNMDIVENFEDSLTVGEVNDDTFNNAVDVNENPLYTECSIGKDKTNGLPISGVLSVDTFCMNAQAVYNNEFHKKLDKSEGRKIARQIAKAVNANMQQARLEGK